MRIIVDSNLVISGNWELRNNDQELVMLFDVDELRYRITSLTPNKLELDLIESSLPAGAFRYRLTLTR